MLAQTAGEALAVLRPPPGDRHGPLTPALLMLTLVTGVVDAVSYLALGHVFVANMTGNLVFLGFALAGASGLSSVTSAVAIGAFLLGAFAGGWLAASGEHRGRLLRTATLTQALLLALALGLSIALAHPLGTPGRYALLIPLAVAMGIQNNAAQRLNVPDMTTTVLTKTLTGLAGEARVTGGGGSRPGRRLIAVAAMLLGAAAGAQLTLEVHVAAALGIAFAVVGVVAVWMHVISSRPGSPWAGEDAGRARAALEGPGQVAQG